MAYYKKSKRVVKKAAPKKKMNYKPKPKKISLVRSLVIPRSTFVKVVDYFTGYIASGTVQTGYATIYAGQLTTPYNSGAPITATNFGTLVPTTGCSVSDNFAGYNIMSSQYSNYKVYGSKLTVNCRPEGSTDTIQMGVFPWASTNQTTLTSMDVDAWNEQPYCTNKIVYSQVQGDKVINKVSPATVLGMTKLQYKVTGDQTTLTGAPQTSMNYNYLVYWRTIDNSNLASNLIFTFKLERLVQFYGPNNINN